MFIKLNGCNNSNNMTSKTKNLLLVAGVIAMVLGVFGAIPAFMQNAYNVAPFYALLLVIGIILFAISFSD